MNERIDELLALAALGELTDAEEAELDAALAADIGLADDLASDLDTAATVQRATAQTPPPTLKGRVLDAIAEVEQEAGTSASTSSASPKTSTPPPPPPTGATPIADARSLRSRRWQPLAAAAALVVLVAGGALIAVRDTGPSPVDAVIEAPDAQRRDFDGPLGGMLSVVYSEELDAFVLDGTDVPVLDESQTYQLWLIDGTVIDSAGLFRPDEDGTVEQRFDDLDPSDVVMGVTVEPAGGSDTPTEPVLATA